MDKKYCGYVERREYFPKNKRKIGAWLPYNYRTDGKINRAEFAMKIEVLWKI